MGYNNPIHSSYFFPDIDNTSGSVLGRIIGPRGRTGRLVGIAGVVIVAVTVAVDVIDIGSVTDDDAYGTMNIAIGFCTNRVLWQRR